MIFRLHLLLILIVGFVLSCSTGPDFERDNENDPESKIFSPDVGDLITSIDSTKNVSLRWKDFSEFEDGFIIQKSYNDVDSFFDLDTLSANSTVFLDSTKKLAVDTFYRIRSFSDDSDSFGTTEIDKLDFSPLISIDATTSAGNQIRCV